MSAPSITPGTPAASWSAVTFTGYRTADRHLTSPGITESYTESMMGFSCKCGRVWEIKTNDFQGKRATPDCGCGAGKKERKSIASYYLPIGLLERVDEYVAAQPKHSKMSVSEGVATLLTAALKKWAGSGEL